MKNWTITVWQENPTGEPENWDWKAESDNGTLLYGYDCSTAERAKEEAKSEIRAHCI